MNKETDEISRVWLPTSLYTVEDGGIIISKSERGSALSDTYSYIDS